MGSMSRIDGFTSAVVPGAARSPSLSPLPVGLLLHLYSTYVLTSSFSLLFSSDLQVLPLHSKTNRPEQIIHTCYLQDSLKFLLGIQLLPLSLFFSLGTLV